VVGFFHDFSRGKLLITAPLTDLAMCGRLCSRRCDHAGNRAGGVAGTCVLALLIMVALLRWCQLAYLDVYVMRVLARCSPSESGEGARIQCQPD